MTLKGRQRFCSKRWIGSSWTLNGAAGGRKKPADLCASRGAVRTAGARSARSRPDDRPRKGA
eukprot:2353421-Alexandrium_andersonii.AAC.1